LIATSTRRTPASLMASAQGGRPAPRAAGFQRHLWAVSPPGPAPASSGANLLACGRGVGSGPGRRWHPHAR
jgi:hypothetical protein